LLVVDPNFNRRADALIGRRQLSRAQALLEGAIREMPAGWKPIRDGDPFVRVAFWAEDEFLTYTGKHKAAGDKSVMWVAGSYPKAWYQLAVIAVEQVDFEDALTCLDAGIELEPDHPELWSEKGYVLGRLERHSEALDCYVRAAAVRDWASAAQVARAWRGQGVQLIDLNRLDEAESALRRSLEFEPGNEIALVELEYIAEEVHSRQTRGKEKIPWFLHSLANPPTDPLTIQLVALVEDLPSIPGPKTVGPENYSQISRVFMDRGWVGFEEEFDRIVPRDRPDYAEVKRDLLREPLFNMRAHRNMARMMVGDESVDDVLAEIFGDTEERKPQ
jgi:tetratricopeptide (TPR) repeat protein